MTQAQTTESFALPLYGQQKPADPVRRGELALPERRRKNGGVVRLYQAEAPNSRVMIVTHRARFECRLDQYRARRLLSLAQFDAGMRFRMAWLYHAEGIKTRDSTQYRYSGTMTPQIEAMDEAEKTICQAYSLLSPMQALVLVSVCGSDDAAGDDKRMKILRRALDRLADEWGIK